MSLFPKLTVGVVALGMLATACSSSAAETTTTVTTSPTTTATPPQSTTTTTATTTTTTLPPLVVADTVNGLPGEPGTEDRRLIGIKIDNHPSSRPQSGLQEADAVYEVLVEAGLTRFIALFHQSDSEFVGPVRSGRPTDSGLMRPLGGPLQISGLQPWVNTIFRRDGTPLIGDNGATTFRMPHRSAPHNLYTTTEGIRQYADDRGMDDIPPPPLFSYGEPAPVLEEATSITFDWSDQPDVVWTWDEEQYLRFNGTEPHEWEDADGFKGQLVTDAIIVLMARRYTASSPDGSGSSVPALDTIGSGEALVFHNGGVLAANWSRPEITDTFLLTDVDGGIVVVPPGRLWIAVFPDNRTVSWE